MIKITNIQVARIIGALLILLSGNAFANDNESKSAPVSAVSFSYTKQCKASLDADDQKLIACKIGTIGPGGGYIFFVDYDDKYPGFTYLEAAPIDAGVENTSYDWCDNENGNANYSIYSPALTTTKYWSIKGVGKGASNTDQMLRKCISGAAHVAHDYSNNGKTDWFLPSLGELKLMYDNLTEAGVGGFSVFPGTSPIFSAGAVSYWSSSEAKSNHAWDQKFYDGTQYFNYKIRASATVATQPYYVRPARAF